VALTPMVNKKERTRQTNKGFIVIVSLVRSIP
jgi:hypothetical protein